MKLIGSGYYYDVYDLGNDRVFKQEKPFIKRIRDLYHFKKKQWKPWLQVVRNSIEIRRHIPYRYALLQRIDQSLIGNPVLKEGINYEQDKVELIGTVIDAASDEAAKKIIDAYIASVIVTWEYGFADGVFNFTLNSGIGKRGEIVLFDFNEITVSKQYVENDIRTKRWLKASSYERLRPTLQLYFKEQTEKFWTLEALNKHWLQK